MDFFSAVSGQNALPETNIAPKNWWLDSMILFLRWPISRCYVSFSKFRSLTCIFPIFFRPLEVQPTIETTANPNLGCLEFPLLKNRPLVKLPTFSNGRIPGLLGPFCKYEKKQMLDFHGVFSYGPWKSKTIKMIVPWNCWLQIRTKTIVFTETNIQNIVFGLPGSKSPVWWRKTPPGNAVWFLLGMLSSRDPKSRVVGDLQLGDEKVMVWITWPISRLKFKFNPKCEVNREDCMTKIQGRLLQCPVLEFCKPLETKDY